ncbi:hypothetical protein HGA92_04500 [Candidatus Gracilibacteria bacterium]|nr:hypothetical protein [Candidatus Gracilibacteria bacterium]NUJ98505.1 hypothetical protein [Candidatus Gracilibacteria bacterium]
MEEIIEKIENSACGQNLESSNKITLNEQGVSELLKYIKGLSDAQSLVNLSTKILNSVSEGYEKSLVLQQISVQLYKKIESANTILEGASEQVKDILIGRWRNIIN